MWIEKLTTPDSDLGTASIVLRLTAIILLLRPMGPWWIAPFILGLAGLTLIFPRILNAAATWYALALLVGLRIADDWPLADNHIYLLGYWCLAIGLALGSHDAKAILARSSRILIGLAFLFAVTWKIFLSPDYLDGRFFTVTFLTDPRFENITVLASGSTRDQLVEAREYMRPLPEGAEVINTPVVPAISSLTPLVTFSTWSTVIIESLCALLFLIPWAARNSIRHFILLIFCIVTYSLAPVAGFGWLLLTMGLAGVDDGERRIRIAYITTWVLVLLYDQIPWPALLVDWIGIPR